jgi:hypothetical protein
LQRLAVQGLVSHLPALEARHLVTLFAIEVQQFICGVLLTNTVAVHAGTILQGLLLFHHVALTQKLLILFELLRA